MTTVIQARSEMDAAKKEFDTLRSDGSRAAVTVALALIRYEKARDAYLDALRAATGRCDETAHYRAEV